MNELRKMTCHGLKSMSKTMPKLTTKKWDHTGGLEFICGGVWWQDDVQELQQWGEQDQ